MFEDIMPFFPHIDSVSPKLTPYLGTDTHLPTVLSAFLTIYLVSFVSLSQRLQSFLTNPDCVLLASFNQFPTLFRTYLEKSDFKGSNIGEPNAGFCSNISVCLHQTPREQKTEEQI